MTYFNIFLSGGIKRPEEMERSREMAGQGSSQNTYNIYQTISLSSVDGCGSWHPRTLQWYPQRSFITGHCNKCNNSEKFEEV